MNGNYQGTQRAGVTRRAGAEAPTWRERVWDFSTFKSLGNEGRRMGEESGGGLSRCDWESQKEPTHVFRCVLLGLERTTVLSWSVTWSDLPIREMTLFPVRDRFEAEKPNEKDCSGPGRRGWGFEHLWQWEHSEGIWHLTGRIRRIWRWIGYGGKELGEEFWTLLEGSRNGN